MMEVSMFKDNFGEYLKVELRTLEVEAVQTIMSIPGWFKGRGTMVYGLPFSALPEFIRKTEDMQVIWKSEVDNMGTLVKGIDTKDIPTDYIIPYEPKIELRPHQIQNFNLTMVRDTMLVADQEGVGKTPPMLCSIEAKFQNNVANRALWVTKAGLVYDVKNQANKFTNLEVVILDGPPKKRSEKMQYVHSTKNQVLMVTSYETYRTDINKFAHMNMFAPFDIMVIDEAHKMKESTTTIGKYIHYMDVKQKYAMTASPIINEIKDVHNVLQWLGLLNYNFFIFKQKFCNTGSYGEVVSYKHLKEIKTMLQANMLRRLKNDVLKDLPPVVYKNVYVDMTAEQKRLYKMVEREDPGIDFEELDFEDVPTELAKFARLMQIAQSTAVVGGEEGVKGSAKLKELEDMLADFSERGEKAIVFSTSKKFTNIMYKHFEQYNPAIITGDISAVAKASQEISDRQAEVDKFQEDPTCKVIFCSAAASREGWTGTAANNIVFVGKEFSPSYISQCIGRAWRFGAQVHQSINVYSIIARDTIDEKVEMLLQEKQNTIINMVETPMGTKQILKILEGA